MNCWQKLGWRIVRFGEVGCRHPLIGTLWFCGVAVAVAIFVTNSDFIASAAKVGETSPLIVTSICLAFFSLALGLAMGMLYGQHAKIYEDHRKERYIAWLLLEMKRSMEDEPWISATRERLLKDALSFSSRRFRRTITLAYTPPLDIAGSALQLERELRILSL